MLPDITVEFFPDRHHFDPPHRIEPAASGHRCDPSGLGPGTPEPDVDGIRAAPLHWLDAHRIVVV